MRGRNSLSVKSIASLAALCMAASGLGGCIVPEAGPLLGHDVKKRLFYDVVRGVQCEIRHAVLDQINRDRDGEWGKRKFKWLEDWAAKMTLKFKVDDTTAFTPGATLKTPNLLDAHVSRADGSILTIGQSYNFGIGGGLTLDAQRDDEVDFAYDFGTFLDRRNENVRAACYHFGGVTIGGDLQLKEWLDDALEPVKQCAFLGEHLDAQEAELDPLRSIEAAGPVPPWCRDTDLSKDPRAQGAPILDFSHEVTFMITFDVNATPQWNLVRITAANAKLFDASRKDTGDLIITLGPKEKVAPGNRVKRGGAEISSNLTPEALSHHTAMQIGSAVRN